jgi:hypothetical protein
MCLCLFWFDKKLALVLKTLFCTSICSKTFFLCGVRLIFCWNVSKYWSFNFIVIGKWLAASCVWRNFLFKYSIWTAPTFHSVWPCFKKKHASFLSKFFIGLLHFLWMVIIVQYQYSSVQIFFRINLINFTCQVKHQH